MALFENVGEDVLISVPIEGGFIRYGALTEMVDALDGLPDNALIEVHPHELRYEETNS